MLILLSFIYAGDFKISLSDTGKFIAGDPSKDTPLHLVKLEDADAFNFRSDTDLPEKVYITLSKNAFLSWKIQDVHHDGESSKELLNELVYSPLQREKTQMFKFVPIDFLKKTYWIGNDVITNCLTWDSLKLKFEMAKCDEYNKNQLFEIFPIEARDVETDPLKRQNLVDNLNLSSKGPHGNGIPTLEDIEKSHKLESEGENLISTIYDILNKVDICLSRTGSCGSYEEALKSFYKRSFKGSASSQKMSYESRASKSSASYLSASKG